MSNIKKPSLLTAHKKLAKHDAGKKESSKGADNFLDTVKMVSGEALVLVSGKTKKNIFEYTTSGFQISEGNEADDSISDRMDHVYSHMNNLIYVQNQHGVQMNHVLKANSGSDQKVDPKKLLDGIKSLEKGFYSPNEVLTDILRKNEMSATERPDDDIDATMMSIRRKFTALCNVDEALYNKIDTLETKLANMETEMKENNKKKADITYVKEKSKKIKYKIKTNFEEQISEITKNTEYVKTKLDNELLQLNENLKELKKDTTWKITDFEELLKQRATESFVETCVQAGNQNMELEIQNFKHEFERKLDKLNSFIQTLPSYSKGTESFNLKQESFTKDENIKMTTNVEINKSSSGNIPGTTDVGLDEVDKQKLEHIHMKTFDTLNLCTDLSARHEETRAWVKKLMEEGDSFSLFETNITNKVTNHDKNLEHIQRLISMLDKKMKGMGDVNLSNNKESSSSLKKDEPVSFEPLNLGGGVSSDEFEKLSQKIVDVTTSLDKDREEWSKNQSTIDKLKRRMNENEENIKNQKTQITTQSQTIVNLQSEIGFKVDRDTFEQAVHSKQETEVFNTKMSEISLWEDTLKGQDLEVKKINKILEEELEKLKKKTKSHSKKIAEIQIKLDIATDVDKNENLKKAMEVADKVEGLGDYSYHIRKDLDDVIGSVKKLTNILRTMKQDQIKSLANTRAVLCLSCGRGDVNFMPPTDYIKGEDGRFYKTDFIVKNNQVLSVNNPEEEFEYGMDAFTRHEIVKEHTLKSHLPIDLIQQNQVDPKQPQEKMNLKKMRPMSAMNGGVIKGRTDKDRLPQLNNDSSRMNTSQENNIPPLKPMNVGKLNNAYNPNYKGHNLRNSVEGNSKMTSGFDRSNAQSQQTFPQDQHDGAE